MTAAQREAERLRRCRALFERALHDHVDMAEAKRRLHADRWAQVERRLTERRRGTAEASASLGVQFAEQWWQRS